MGAGFPIGLDSVSSLALTTECVCKAGLRLHVKASTDGVNLDNVDLHNFELSPQARFLKVIVENLDNSEDIASRNVTATLGR